MAIAPLQTANIPNVPRAHEATSAGMESLANQAPANGADVNEFTSALNSQIAAAGAPLSAVSQQNLAGYVGEILGGMIDTAEASKKKMGYMLANPTKLGPKGLLELQKTIDDYSGATLVFAKVVSAAAKQIESLTHIQ